MVFKGQFMWGQVVFLTDKHSMDMGLYLYRRYQNLLLHLAHGVAAVVAAAPKNPPKISPRLLEIQNGKISILPFLTLAKSIVSLLSYFME